MLINVLLYESRQMTTIYIVPKSFLKRQLSDLNTEIGPSNVWLILWARLVVGLTQGLILGSGLGIKQEIVPGKLIIAVNMS